LLLVAVLVAVDRVVHPDRAVMVDLVAVAVVAVLQQAHNRAD
jgi:hypothetical protein